MKNILIWRLLKYEFLQFTRAGRNKGLVVYLIGLPFIPYVSAFLTNSSDSALGVSVLSIFLLNILYGPNQFILDQRYYEGLFAKNFDFADLIKAKLSFLLITNMIMFLIQVPLLLIFFDLERFLFAMSVLLYSIGFASPASIFLSGINFNYNDNSFSKKYNMNYFKLGNVFYGIIPFVPGVFLIVFFPANFPVLIIINVAIVLISLLFINRICRFASNRILNKKFLC